MGRQGEAEFTRRTRRTTESQIEQVVRLVLDRSEMGLMPGFSLALKLAMAHVPGMQVSTKPSKRGRKRTWKDGLGSELVRDVVALQRAKKLNYKQAIAELRR